MGCRGVVSRGRKSSRVRMGRWENIIKFIRRELMFSKIDEPKGFCDAKANYCDKCI